MTPTKINHMSVFPGKETLFKDIGYVLAGVAAALAQPLYKWLKRKGSLLDWTNRKIDSQKLIYDKLGELRSWLDVDRVAIVEFSNTEKSVSNFPFLFMTMTYERVADHIAPIKERMHKVPSSWFANLHSYLVPDSVHRVTFVEDGSIIIDNQTAIYDESVIRALKSYNMRSRTFIKLTKKIGDGILEISQYDQMNELSATQWIEVDAVAAYVWYNANVKH